MPNNCGIKKSPMIKPNKKTVIMRNFFRIFYSYPSLMTVEKEVLQCTPFLFLI